MLLTLPLNVYEDKGSADRPNQVSSADTMMYGTWCGYGNHLHGTGYGTHRFQTAFDFSGVRVMTQWKGVGSGGSGCMFNKGGMVVGFGV